MPEILTLNNFHLAKNGYKLVYGNDTVYNLHLDQVIGGTITANKMTGYYGDVVTLYNNPSSGYSFDNYSVTGSTLTGVQVRFNREDIYVAPSFIHNVYNINLQQTTGGTITSDKSTGYYGDTVTLYNTPAEHYGFRDYSITGATLTGNQFKINESNVTAKANFSAWPVRNVSVQQRTGGTIASNKSTGYDGDVVTLSNTANVGYTFTNYNVTGATLTGNHFAFNGGNVTAQGAFNHNVYNLTLQTDGHGKLVAGKTTGYYNDTTTLTPTPSSYYTFSAYSANAGTITNNTFKWGNKNATAKAFFYKQQRSLTLQQLEGGKITANKITGYDGDTITLSNTANINCSFSKYNLTGATLTGNNFIFNGSNVTANADWNVNYNGILDILWIYDLKYQTITSTSLQIKNFKTNNINGTIYAGKYLQYTGTSASYHNISNNNLSILNSGGEFITPNKCNRFLLNIKTNGTPSNVSWYTNDKGYWRVKWAKLNSSGTSASYYYNHDWGTQGTARTITITAS